MMNFHEYLIPTTNPIQSLSAHPMPHYFEINTQHHKSSVNISVCTKRSRCFKMTTTLLSQLKINEYLISNIQSVFKFPNLLNVTFLRICLKWDPSKSRKSLNL